MSEASSQLISPPCSCNINSASRTGDCGLAFSEENLFATLIRPFRASREQAAHAIVCCRQLLLLLAACCSARAASTRVCLRLLSSSRLRERSRCICSRADASQQSLKVELEEAAAQTREVRACWLDHSSLNLLVFLQQLCFLSFCT